MSDKIPNVNLVNVEKINGLQNEAKLQAEVIGGLRQNISQLKERQAEDAKKVIIEERTQQRQYDPYGTPVGSTYLTSGKITKVNMEDAVELIAKHVNENNEAELKEITNKLDKANRQHDRLDAQLKDNAASHARSLDSMNSQYREKDYQNKKFYEEDNAKLKHRLEDVKKELDKTKKDKTDEKVEQERKEEVGKLKARVKGLEREVKRLSTQSWLGKVWDRISNRPARIEALKQRADEAAEAPIKAGNGLGNPFHMVFPSFF